MSRSRSSMVCCRFRNSSATSSTLSLELMTPESTCHTPTPITAVMVTAMSTSIRVNPVCRWLDDRNGAVIRSYLQTLRGYVQVLVQTDHHGNELPLLQSGAWKARQLLLPWLLRANGTARNRCHGNSQKQLASFPQGEFH